MHRQVWINLATLGPVGRIRPAPGTLGSAAALLPAAAQAWTEVPLGLAFDRSHRLKMLAIEHGNRYMQW